MPPGPLSPSAKRIPSPGSAPTYSLSSSGKRGPVNANGIDKSLLEASFSDRNSSLSRRWPKSLSAGGGSVGSSSSSGEGGGSSSSGKKTNSITSKPTFSISRGGGGVNVRPSSSSTIESFASAMPFSSDDSSSAQNKKSFSSSRSSSSSTNRTYTDPLAKGKKFEELLASGETLTKSETANVAKASPNQKIRDSRNQNLPILTTRKGSRRVDGEFDTNVQQVKEEDEEEEDAADGEVEAKEEAISRLDNGENESQSLTPRLPSSQSPNTSLWSPIRPPKSVERSPSISTYRTSAYDTPPSGGASPVIPTTALPLALPIHPHHRGEMVGEEQNPQNNDSQRLDGNQTLTPSSRHLSKPTPALPKSPSPVLSPVSPSLTSTSSFTSKSRGRTSEALSPSSFSNSSQTTFTLFPRQGNSLAQEFYRNENEGDDIPAEKSGLKERLKKTSGFLKRLGGGNSADKNRLQPPRMPKMVRKSSHSSFASDGGASVANSTKSAPGDYQSRWDNEMTVPVPSIPSKYKGKRKSPGKHRQNQEHIESLPSESSILSGEEDPPSVQRSGHSRTTSSSAGGSVGSASTDMRHALKAWENEMDATLKQSGQDLESKTKIETPKPNWTPSPQLPEYKLNRKSSFMDEKDDEDDGVEMKETLKDEKGESSLGFARSKENTKDNSTSFDSQFLSPQSHQQSQQRGGTSIGIGRPSGIKPQSTIVQSDPISSTTTFSSSSSHLESSNDSFQYRRSRDDNPSYASAMSYETAIDRPSFFVRHAHREDASKDDGKTEEKGLSKDEPMGNQEKTMSSDSGIVDEGEMDPEKSIRLITNASSNDANIGTSPAMSPIQENFKHAKERTLTSADIPSRSTSPAVDLKSQSPTGEAISEENEIMAKELALKCWNEDESFKKKEKIAEWLGGAGLVNKLARRHYMDNLDLGGLRIDAAFRKLCDKLFLRAETQQIDRILSAFSLRFFTCNPQSKTVLLNADVIHALVFSILLLNTDLHVADIQDRMTRSQFVRNTLAAIQESSEAVPSQNWASPPSMRNEDAYASRSSLNISGDVPTSDPSPSTLPLSSRLTPSRRVSNDATSNAGSDSIKGGGGLSDSRLPLNKAWEVEMEGVLKEIYAAVKNDQIRLPITDTSSLAPLQQRKMQRMGSDRVNALKRGSIRGIQGLLGTNSNNLRSDENLNMSRTSLNSTQRSYSDYPHSTPSTSMASASSYGFQPSGLPPTLGFANTLSQSIIKEANDEEDNCSIDSTNDDFTDDELALMGPPWAKEGMLTRKHYWESNLKRAKDKNWTDCFVVVQKGMLSMFRFGVSGTGNASSSGVGGVGGGNWLSNATCIGEFSLAHTLANSLPPPGYNRSRPHVFALTLPSGSVYFFQTGHEELVQEWVSTCNYWAARQSREPLAGGVSNMEYGWNRVMPVELGANGYDDDDAITSSSHLELTSLASKPSISHANHSSDTRSIRSGRSGKSGKSLRMRATNNSLFQSWQSDRNNGGGAGLSSPVPSSFRASSSFLSTEGPMFVNEWRAPAPPTVSSMLNEEDQLEACKRHKARIESELTQHNALRKPMLEYFESIGSHQNTATVTKAISNFDKKASYLLSDLTKFTLYAATLTSSNKLKAEKRDARQLNRMMLKADEELSRVKEEEEGPPVMSGPENTRNLIAT